MGSTTKEGRESVKLDKSSCKSIEEDLKNIRYIGPSLNALTYLSTAALSKQDIKKLDKLSHNFESNYAELANFFSKKCKRDFI